MGDKRSWLVLGTPLQTRPCQRQMVPIVSCYCQVVLGFGFQIVLGFGDFQISRPKGTVELDGVEATGALGEVGAVTTLSPPWHKVRKLALIIDIQHRKSKKRKMRREIIVVVRCSLVGWIQKLLCTFFIVLCAELCSSYLGILRVITRSTFTRQDANDDRSIAVSFDRRNYNCGGLEPVGFLLFYSKYLLLLLPLLHVLQANFCARLCYQLLLLNRADFLPTNLALVF
jgi:hypothetical protein